MSDETIGKSVQGGKLRNRSGLHPLRSEPCRHEIRRAFLAQRIDSAFFDLKMEQEPVGPTAVTECL